MHHPNQFKMPPAWDGWYWHDNLYLADCNGNRYSQDMVRSSLYTMELARELTGSPLKIQSLKQELQRRLEIPPPEVIVRWQGQETRIVAPGWIRQV